MPKSNSKISTVPAPVPAKTPKTRLTKFMRDTLYRHMCDLFVQRLDRTDVEQTLFPLVEKANAILRAKYPKEDMVVLRRYDMAHVDSCLKFTVPDTGRVFGVYFSRPHILPTPSGLADIPCRSGCYNSEIYPCDSTFEALADKWEKQMNERHEIIRQKEREFNSFLQACRYLDEVAAVLPISEEMRKSLGAQTQSLTVINPEIISRIKSDFAVGVAA